MRRTVGITAVIAFAFALAACAEETNTAVEPPGAPETTKTKALEAGARVLQRSGPSAKLDVHLVSFHPLVDDPMNQITAHHYCKQVNEEFIQCALWDSNADDANLNGVEHIISARLFERLPPEERQYWHPHNYEILSGLLVAPGLPRSAELALMRRLINSYGRTWHVWNTGTNGETLPQGPAELAWSFNADGEVHPELVEARDRAFNIDTAKIRAERQSLVPLIDPQQGEDRLADAFENRVEPPWAQPSME